MTSDLGVRAMLEYLYDRRARNLPPRALAEVFDRLIWCFDDNGAELTRVCDDWLRSFEEDGVRIVLEMRECFPFPTLAEMDEVLRELKRRWPDLSSRCDELLNAREGD